MRFLLETLDRKEVQKAVRFFCFAGDVFFFV